MSPSILLVADKPSRRPASRPARGDATVAALPEVVARQEYLLSSLVELSRKLWGVPDVHDVADAVLLGLMGQIGTAQAALWLGAETHAAQPVLIRCHGIRRPLAEAIAVAGWYDLLERFRSTGGIVTPGEVRHGLGKSTVRLADRAGVALFAPLCTDDAPFGLVALGLPSRRVYSAIELEVIEASLAVAGLAFQAAHLHNFGMETTRILERANADLGELDRMKSDFIDRVNHQFRTPLTVMLGCLEGLSTRGMVHEGSEVLVQAANENARRLQRLVERLLTFAECRHGDLAIDAGVADLRQFLVRYCEERRPGVSAGLRELLVDCPVAYRARFDPRRLRQMLDELVDNAVHFSLPGTRIWLRLSESLEGDRSWGKISVEDQGFGISPERLPLLFLAFRHVEGSLTRPSAGLGLGLAAAKELAEAMGGRIEATSTEGQGSVFSVLMPAN